MVRTTIIAIIMGSLFFAATAKNKKRYKTSVIGRDKIKEFEGLRLLAYPDGNGYSVGYGHWRQGDEQKGLVITTEKAEQFFNEDIEMVENQVNKAVKVLLTQNMFDALVSFVYNRGIGTFNKSTVLSALNKGNYRTAANELLNYSANNSGLLNRRYEEYKMFIA